jgi:hypothetical protein
MSRTSSICRPIRWHGFSAVIGSWKIIDTDRPRIPHQSASLNERVSAPPIVSAPAVIRALSGNRPRRASATLDFPLPDSPMTPTISLRFTCRLTPDTASGPSP